jgi:hypothetical protein
MNIATVGRDLTAQKRSEAQLLNLAEKLDQRVALRRIINPKPIDQKRNCGLGLVMTEWNLTASTMDRQMERPSPMPLCLVEMNGSNR